MTLTGIGWRHPHYGELLQTRPALGFVEVHSENFFGEGGAALAMLDAARQVYPVSLHGVGLGLGSAAGIDDWHLSRLERLVSRIEPVRVSDHACFARGPLGGKTVHAADLLPIPFNDAALAVLSANVQRVQDRLKRPLLVENVSAYIEMAGSDRHETDFLGALVRRTGCRLLVDVNNIYVNALNAQLAGSNLDPVAACMHWLDLIPADAVGEIHLAGHCAMEDIVIDDHGSLVCAEVWRIYSHAIGRFGAVPSLVEWDTAIPPLATLLDEAQRAHLAARAQLEPAR
jgi:uncharacterized protein (UPF0276 family)